MLSLHVENVFSVTPGDKIFQNDSLKLVFSYNSIDLSSKFCVVIP